MATLFISFSYQPAVLQYFCCLSPSRKRGSTNNYTSLMLHCSLSPEEIEVEKKENMSIPWEFEPITNLYCQLGSL